MSMSTTRPTPKALRLYVQAVVCVGGLTLFQAVLDSARTPQPLAWLTLAVLALVSGWYRLTFTSVSATIGIDDAFWITTALLFGPGPATLAIVAHGVMFSIRRQWPVVNKST